MSELLPCPCGKVPPSLCISDESNPERWKHVSGGCCGEWEIEFRAQYQLGDDLTREATEAWNAAPRPLPAAEQAANPWRPIESAPEDGTHILLWWRTCLTPVSGRWVDGGEGGHGGWRGDGDMVIPTNQGDCTHWMPLPEPPEGE